MPDSEVGAGASSDPDDDKFLSCAKTAGVEIIVSGDKHLLRVSGWAGIQILPPREFVEGYLTDPAR